MTPRKTHWVGRPAQVRLLAAALVFTTFLGAALGMVLSPGCAKRGAEGGGSRPAVDRSLMACLGAMRAYHRQADVHLARGDARAAVHSVEQILGLGCVARNNPEVQEAVLDAYGRLGRLHLKLGELDQASERVAEGLKRPGAPSFFRANLHMVQGDLLDARAEAVERDGKKAEADALRRQAIEAFDRSAKMNMGLLKELVK